MFYRDKVVLTGDRRHWVAAIGLPRQGARDVTAAMPIAADDDRKGLSRSARAVERRSLACLRAATVQGGETASASAFSQIDTATAPASVSAHRNMARGAGSSSDCRNRCEGWGPLAKAALPHNLSAQYHRRLQIGGNRCNTACYAPQAAPFA